MNYLIYHPKRQISEIGDLKVYHDSFGHNEDPYIWNKNFLHSFCHITQIKPEVGSRIFWISGDTYPDFNRLNCDCVFVVKEKIYWTTANKIEITKAIQSLYGVNPVKVNIIKVGGKAVNFGRVSGKRKNFKKAIVTLRKGERIEVFEGV